MRVNLKATNYDLTPQLRAGIEEKLGEIGKYFNNIQGIDVEVGAITSKQNKGRVFFCEINVSVPGKLLRYRKDFDDLNRAVTEAKKGIKEQLREYKEMLGGK